MVHIGITGATGLLGSALMTKIGSKSDWSAHALDRTSIQGDPQGTLRKLHRLHNLECVIHCAAHTNVDACEKAPEISLKDNFEFSRDVAQACAQLDLKMVYISSTGVYGSERQTPYRESDTPHPTTVHHKHKLMAEQAALSCSVETLVVRTGWLFGGEISNPKNFVANRLREIFLCDGEMNSDVSQIGNPTFVDDLADHIVILIERNERGIFNCVSPDPASRFEYVQQILLASRRDVQLNPVDGSSFQRVAKTSPNESAINQSLSDLGLNNMLPWQQRLADYVPSILECMKNEV